MGPLPLVILVEPAPALREVLKVALEDDFWCQVEDRDSVHNLLEVVRQQKPTFILLDVEVPGATRFLTALKDDPWLGSIPVIRANLVGLQTDEWILAAGYDVCFRGDLDHLEGLVRRYLAARSAPRVSR